MNNIHNKLSSDGETTANSASPASPQHHQQTTVPSIEQIDKVLQTLFTHHDSNLQNEANKWLLELQNHPNIVPLCLELIKVNQTFFSQFFGIQTLYTKIHSDWESKWSDEFRHNVKNTVFNRFLYEKESNSPVFNSKVSSCLSAVNLLNILNSDQSTEATKKGILDILYLLPIEFETVILSNSRRIAIKDNFYQNSESVIMSISKFLTLNISSQFNILLLKSVRNWIRFSNSKVILKSQLLANIFNIINNQEVIIECLSLIGDLINFHTYVSLISTNERPTQPQDPDQANFQLLIVPTIRKLMELKPIYEESIQKDNIFICRAFAELVSQIVECYAPIMLDVNILEVQQCLTFLLELCSHPNKEISEITFDAWSLHSEHGSILETGGEPFQKLYIKLLQLLLERSSFPPDIQNVKPDCELAEDMSNYRNNACDIIVSCFEMIRGDQFIEFIQNLLKNQCKSWQSYEVVFYVFRCVCSNMMEDDDPLKGKDILSFSLTLPYHSTLSTTILYLFEDYGDFISATELLTPTLNYILNLLQHTEIRLINILLNPIIVSFKSIVSMPNDNYLEKSLLLGNSLAVLDASLNFPDDAILLLKEFVSSFWGLLEEINNLAISHLDSNLLELLWSVFWKIIVGLERQFPFLDKIFVMLLSAINQFKTLGSKLYEVMGLLIDFFGKDPTYQNHFINLISTLLNRALPVLVENNSESTPTIIRVYKLLLKVLEQCPVAFNSSPNIVQIIDLSIEFLLNGENESIKSILDFLNHLFIKMNPHESFLKNYSLKTLTNAFKALVNDQSRDLTNYISLFLYNWVSKYSSTSEHQRVLLDCFVQSTWLPADVPYFERERLSKLMLITNQTRFKSLITDIASVCNRQMTYDVFISYELGTAQNLS
ncbi:hypothetical protein DICPUDRAFT_149595 [Dictyostelium purpureum]|uniref:Importin N-terminal domain-containing protein n=1 Tax=Dictyostelium purpureum TaxID=5786 RepID=F0ZE77_DICPU|nr:uncharacterized protein DICPUDRAFT_149595 [Dictyostelium purpureum]EGC37755.1 hypothetical protein DICPUDRAFT_149595 [Dictyostelium purpureum]|eukprot:XP_003285694.1 hypothetical protein DICPUDRAFT_149595 [Dictyostelium purpureum]